MISVHSFGPNTAPAGSHMYTWLTLLADQVYGCDYQALAIQYYENAEVTGPFSGAFFPPPPGAPGACCTYTLFPMSLF